MLDSGRVRQEHAEDTSQVISDYFVWLAGGVLAIIFVYVCVRVGSFAYFRTKLEYLKAGLKEMRKEEGDNNGV